MSKDQARKENFLVFGVQDETPPQDLIHERRILVFFKRSVVRVKAFVVQVGVLLQVPLPSPPAPGTRIM